MTPAFHEMPYPKSLPCYLARKRLLKKDRGSKQPRGAFTYLLSQSMLLPRAGTELYGGTPTAAKRSTLGLLPDMSHSELLLSALRQGVDGSLLLERVALRNGALGSVPRAGSASWESWVWQYLSLSCLRFSACKRPRSRARRKEC